MPAPTIPDPAGPYGVAADGITVGFAAACGFVGPMVVQDGGRVVDLLHRAPWRADEVPAGAPPHHAGLRGDFFCAPFGNADGDAAPLHGWTANGTWDVVDRGPEFLFGVLDRTVHGARVTKTIAVRDRHPFLYQRHLFTAGAGAIPVANHAMVALPHGGWVTTSAKQFYQTPGTALESDPARGRSLLAYPARGNARAFPLAQGGTVDLGRYPLGTGHEDFVIGVEAAGHAFGWTAVARAEGDLFLSLRRADQLPLTMLWHSNGGRHYAPWSSRHTGVMGVEDGVGLALLGLSAQETPCPLTAAGQPTALHLGGCVDVRHVIGALHWPTGEPVASVTPGAGQLRITGHAGAIRDVPFDDTFLA
jgi:hypothetical protein